MAKVAEAEASYVAGLPVPLPLPPGPPLAISLSLTDGFCARSCGTPPRRRGLVAEVGQSAAETSASIN